MAKKGRRSTSSKRLAKKTQKMMKSSCMWGGDSAPYSGSGSGATGYGEAIYGPANAQTNNGMGSNNIMMKDPAVVWKGGQRGGGSFSIPVGATNINILPVGATASTAESPVTINWTESTVDATSGKEIGSSGGSMLGAAIVPAALLAANQLYKPTRALKNLSYSRKNGFRKTMKKFRKGRR
jgi:hypothetical protein